MRGLRREPCVSDVMTSSYGVLRPGGWSRIARVAMEETANDEIVIAIIVPAWGASGGTSLFRC